MGYKGASPHNTERLKGIPKSISLSRRLRLPKGSKYLVKSSSTQASGPGHSEPPIRPLQESVENKASMSRYQIIKDLGPKIWSLSLNSLITWYLDPLRVLKVYEYSLLSGIFAASSFINTQRLLCSSFLAMTYFLLSDYSILPEKELHSSLWVEPTLGHLEPLGSRELVGS